MRKYNATLFNTRGRLYYTQIIYIISLQFYGSECRRVFERTVILFFLRKTIPLQWGYEILLEVKNRFFFSSKEITWSTNTKTKFMMRQVTALWRKVRLNHIEITGQGGIMKEWHGHEYGWSLEVPCNNHVSEGKKCA